MNIVNGDGCLSERDANFSRKGDFYPGIDAFISEGILHIHAVPDTYEPGYVEVSAKINYCPMCGRRLEEK